MPTISVSIRDLKSLLSQDIPTSQLIEILPLNKISIVEAVGDELRLEVTPDRPDLFSPEGIARQLDYWMEFRQGFQEFKVLPPEVQVFSKDVQSRPSIVAGAIRNLSLNYDAIKSLMQLQEFLDLTLGRDRKKISIGIHDMGRLHPPFYYKEVFPGTISFVPLGMDKKMNLREILKSHPKGMKYRHLLSGKKFPILLDSQNQTLSFPPIINGELTKVTESTKDIFIDITGYDTTPMNYALNILVTALEKRGGKIESVVVNGKTYPHLSPRNIKIDFSEVRSVLGINEKDSQITGLLKRMGYGYDQMAKNILIPPYRTDILHHADLIEDIAIAFGFNNFIPEVPRHHSIGKPDKLEEFSNLLRHLLAGLGFQEVINFTLVSSSNLFKKMNLEPQAAAEIRNPISNEYGICRVSIIPSLLENLSSNKHRRYPQKIFEVADCIEIDPKEETRTKNMRRLGFAISYHRADFSDLLSYLNAIKENLGISFGLENASHNSYIPGRCGSVLLAGKNIGIFGEIHPSVLANWDLEKPVIAFEVEVWPLMKK